MRKDDTPDQNLEKELMEELDELFENLDVCRLIDDLREECQRSALPNKKLDNYQTFKC